MEDIQNTQIMNSDVNQNTTTTQTSNQLVSMGRMAAIELGGLTKRGGLTQQESNVLAASRTYQWDDGQNIPGTYENIYSQQQNLASAIVNTTAIINSADNQSYVPNQGQTNKFIR